MSKPFPNKTPEQLYSDIKTLHAALCEVLTVAAFERGWNHAWVQDALQVLARHPELPVSKPIEMAMNKQFDEKTYEEKDRRKIRERHNKALAQFVKAMEE